MDYYVFRKLKTTLPVLKNRYTQIIYWLISFSLIGFLILFSLLSDHKTKDLLWSGFTTVSILLLLVYIPKTIAALLFLIADIFSLIIKSDRINKIIRKILLIIFIVTTGLIELSIIYGVFYGRFNYKKPVYEILDSQIPPNFDNYRIVHLSDLHLGSFSKQSKRLDEIIEITNSLEPDLIVFTGDLVNNTTKEAWRFQKNLAKLSAKDGIIAVTGNHDYGTYVTWDSDDDFHANFESLKEFYESIGATLLLNEHINISRGNQEIYIAGIESSGMPPFDELGDIDKSLEDIPENAFVIMLSHDPSYWRSTILKYPEVNLTLSGHTHSMQMGLWSERLGLKWSPIKYMYREWHGMYRENNQSLIISSGAGFIALPARIGAPPEIGLVILKSKEI